MSQSLKSIMTRLRHSLIAMFVAWVACGLTWGLAGIPVFAGAKASQLNDLLIVLAVFGVNSAIYLGVVWLLLVLPLEWLLKADRSRCSNRHGLKCGLLAALPFALFWVAVAGFLARREKVVTSEMVLGTIPYVLATLAVGGPCHPRSRWSLPPSQ